MRELWFADGYELTKCGVRDISYGSAIYSTAGKRGSNTEVAQRHGDIWRPKMYQSAAFTLTMTVVEKSGFEAAMDAYRTLLRVMHRQDGLVMFERRFENGTRHYRCFGEVVQAVQPAQLANIGFRMGFEINVPGAFWESGSEYVHISTQGSPLPQTLRLDRHADSTAPIDNMRFVISGPVTNPTVELTRPDSALRESFTYNGTIALGQTLTVDAGTWAVTGTGGLVIDQARLDYRGARYLTVQPHRPNDPVGAPQLVFSGASGGSETRLGTVGRSKVLV